MSASMAVKNATFNPQQYTRVVDISDESQMYRYVGEFLSILMFSGVGKPPQYRRRDGDTATIS